MHRYRTWARDYVRDRRAAKKENIDSGNTLANTGGKKKKHPKTGGLNEKGDGRGSPSGSAADTQQYDGTGGERGVDGGAGDHSGGIDTTTANDAEDAISPAAPPPAPPPHKSEDAGAGDSAIGSAEGNKANLPITQRMLAGMSRFFVHLMNAITHSWVNVLLIFVPIGIAAEAAGLSAAIVFAMNAVAIIPLAGLLAFATEAVAVRLGDTLGALLNVSFGNAVELIIFIIALVKKEIAIVQASLLGSILANLLLILGMAFLLGGLRYREQIYNSTVTQMSACLLSLSVISLLLPTAFYASFKTTSGSLADQQVLKVSRGTSVVLLIIYVLYLLFQLKSHAYMYESTPQEVIDEESHPGVLADVMNSSSSSDDSSSSDSTDSDTSGSGSVAAAGKKIKRVFRHRRRGKSSASTSSATHSHPSSPSVQDRSTNYWDASIVSQHASRRPSQLASLTTTDNGAEADNEDNSNNRTLIRDFVTANGASAGSATSPERKKQRKKHSKKHNKKRNQTDPEKYTVEATDVDILGGEKVETPIEEHPPRTVGFAQTPEATDTLEPMATPGGSFNMRQFSSVLRPGLPKLLSNNVFVTPPPAPAPPVRPMPPMRSQSAGNNLRRTSSLPDRLNKQISNQSTRTPAPMWTDPLPPFQHQRPIIRRTRDDAMDNHSDASDDDKPPAMSRTAAVVLLLCSTALVAVCAEFMVDAIPDMLKDNPGISQTFIGLIILPIVGNAAEHVTAVVVAMKNKMDLAIGVAVGSSIQIALFVTPIVVLLGWILQTNMSLYFNLFETISLFVTAFVVNFLVLDGRSNYLEGSLLIAAYVIIALGAFFYPAVKDQSQAGGGA